MRCIAISLLLPAFASSAVAADDDSTKALVKRGSTLVLITACSDCQTAAFATSRVKVAESEGFKGDTLGYSRPRGTIYPMNLRLRLVQMELDAWKSYARSVVLRPPMSYSALNVMEDQDLVAI